ncbi:MAG: hypothetical protein U9R14_03835 [Patescibacteria group bacterium]|nr:hypothetical protein [Patescibacteria group bacterium]
MIKIIPFHSTPKIVWLDTNIINNIADAVANKKMNEIEESRALSLYLILKKLVKEEKIICPFLIQRDEYIDTDVNEICDLILMELGKGEQLKSLSVGRTQTKRMLKMYLENKTDFYFKKDDIFYYKEEPNENDLLETHGFKFNIMYLHSGGDKEISNEDNKKIYEFFKRRKNDIQNNKMKIKEVLKEELLSQKTRFVKAIKEINDLFGFLKTDFNDTDLFYYRIYPLIVHQKFTGKTDIVEVSNFLGSHYFFSVPYEEIYSKIIAKILTSNANIKSTDFQDINSIVAILPYASLMITDKAMKGNIEQLNLYKKYDTKVFSLNDYDQIIAELKKV